MLKERATALQTQIETFKQAKKGVVTTSTLSTRRNELRTNVDKLTKIMDKVRLLRQANITVQLDANLCHVQKTLWIQLRDTQQKDPSYISSDLGIEEKRKAQYTFDALVKQLEQACKETWEKYAREQMPQVDAFLLSVFGKDTVHRDAVAGIKTRLARLNTTASIPDSLIAVNQFRSDCVAVHDAWQGIIGEGLPPAVEKFFTQMRSSATRRVPLALLTPEVQRWITERNITDGFSIVAE